MKTRWEYKIVEGGDKGWRGATHRDHSMDILNRLGLEGWECFHAKTDSFPTIFYMKREK